jgi:hypothetical protein
MEVDFLVDERQVFIYEIDCLCGTWFIDCGVFRLFFGCDYAFNDA